jgi:DNA-binding transcriptional ArsR family regulator
MSLQNSFRALADPTRRQILVILREHDQSIAELAGKFDMTRAAVKKHLSVLESGQLISVQAHGRERINHFEPEGMKAVQDWLQYFDQFWDNKLSALQAAVDDYESTKND